MSLAAFALRLATVHALRGKTLAGSAVKDSPQNPLPNPLPGVQICIYSGRHTVAPDVRELIGGDQSVDLSIHYHCPATVDVTDGTNTLTLEASAGGVGVVFDLMWRQTVRALLADPGPWADLWRSLVVKISSPVESEPFLIEAEKGVRIQARDVEMTVDTLCDPAFGEVVPGSPWAKLLELMRDGDAGMVALASIIEHEITSPDDLPDWTKMRVALGLTEGELAASGLAPVALDMVEPVTEVTVSSPEDSFVVTESTYEP